MQRMKLATPKMPDRLQGVLFFGNGHALSSHLENVNCGAVIIDFAHVTSIDSSGFGQLEAVAKMLHKQKVRLILGINRGIHGRADLAEKHLEDFGGFGPLDGGDVISHWE